MTEHLWVRAGEGGETSGRREHPGITVLPPRDTAPQASGLPSDPLRRTLARLKAHLVNSLSSVLGDDVIGRSVRRALLRAGGAHLGEGVGVHGGSYFSAPGRLTVGDGSFINRSCYFDLEAPVRLGRRVTVGHGTTFVTTRHRLGESGMRCGAAYGEPVVVGDGCWIGANVTIMPGVTLGEGAVVAAGAVVLQDVPADTMVGGVPARTLRKL